MLTELFVSAEKDNMFSELRRKVKVAFSPFLVDV